MWLKQSTADVISFGPFLDKTDGVTYETGLVSALDHATTGIMLSKNGGTMAVRNGTPTPSAYDARGTYKVTLNATDTATLGKLRVDYADPATCLHVWRDFQVVPAQVYNSLVLGSDLLDTQVQTADVTSIRDAILNWAPITGVKLAKIFRVLARFFTSPTTGRVNGVLAGTEVYVDATDGDDLSITYDANGNRTAVDTSLVLPNP